MKDEFNQSFGVAVGVRQGRVMSPWVSDVYTDSCMREMTQKGRAWSKAQDEGYGNHLWQTCLQMIQWCWQRMRDAAADSG